MESSSVEFNNTNAIVWCGSLQCSAVHYSYYNLAGAMQRIVSPQVQCKVVQSRVVQCSAGGKKGRLVLCITLQLCTVQYNPVQSISVQCFIV